MSFQFSTSNSSSVSDLAADLVSDWTSKFSLVLASCALLAGCGAHPIKPEAENIKISRDDAATDCREIGAVEGRNQSVSGTFEQALEDLKLDAARKGANFVRIGQTSGSGTAVRGTAYFCP